MGNIWQSMMDYVFGEMVNGLNDFFTMINGMAADTFDLPWIQAVVQFYHYIGWALFLAGVSVAIFDTVIEAQNGKPSVRDLALNLVKGFMAVSLFTVVPVELFKFCVSLQGQLGDAVSRVFQLDAVEDIGTLASNVIGLFTAASPFNIFVIIGIGYCVIKVFFSNIKRGGILLANIAVGSMYMISVPRGYMDGFVGWCKQVAAICLTAVLQTTILTAGLLTMSHHQLLGLGLMLSAKEVPRIAERFGLDTSARVNFMSGFHAVNAATSMVKGIAKGAMKAV